MEITVPGEDTVKTPLECQLSHVGDNPFLVWQPSARHGNHFRGSIDAGHVQTALSQEPGDRLAPTTAEVEHAAAAGQLFGKGANPELIGPAAASTVRIPLCGVTSIEGDDALRRGCWHLAPHSSGTPEARSPPI